MARPAQDSAPAFPNTFRGSLGMLNVPTDTPPDKRNTILEKQMRYSNVSLAARTVTLSLIAL